MYEREQRMIRQAREAGDVLLEFRLRERLGEAEISLGKVLVEHGRWHPFWVEWPKNWGLTKKYENSVGDFLPTAEEAETQVWGSNLKPEPWVCFDPPLSAPAGLARICEKEAVRAATEAPKPAVLAYDEVPDAISLQVGAWAEYILASIFGWEQEE